MEQSAISGECAASAGEWVEGLLGEFARYLPECRIDTMGRDKQWVRYGTVNSFAVRVIVDHHSAPYGMRHQETLGGT